MYTPRSNTIKSNTPFSSNRKSLSFKIDSRLTNSRFNQSLNNSFHSSFVCDETANHRFELYGAKLPVLVSEALTLAERGTEVTTKISNCGWACLVIGRSLYVWNYTQIKYQSNKIVGCKELTLPPSDLAHKADLVCILPTSSGSFPAILASSPEGSLRFWPNVGHGTSSMELSIELHGQECYSLIETPEGCIMATTTNSLLLISFEESSLKWRQLRAPQGVLAGIGRRMSSLIFGAIPAQSLESKRMVKILKDVQGPITIVYVLAGTTLYKWELGGEELDKMVFELDLERSIKENFLEEVWNGHAASIHQIKCTCIDMQVTKKGPLLLLSATGSDNSTPTYALALLDTSELETLFGFSSFFVPDIMGHVDGLDELKLLLPSPYSQTAYLYTHNKLFIVPISGAQQDIGVVDFEARNSRILGSGSLDEQALFFINTSGFIKVIPNHSEISLNWYTKEPISERADEDGEDYHEVDPQSLVVCLKAALVKFCHQERLILDDNVLRNLERLLDQTVADLSEELVDDIPNTDPRWVSSSTVIQGSQISLILINQLQDKLKAHDYYLKFLHASGFWDKLGMVKIKGIEIPTKLVFLEHAEKLVASIALKNLHSRFDSIMVPVIKMLVDQKTDPLPNTKLTPQDIFYRKVSCIEDIFPALIEDWQEKELSSGNLNITEIISSVNTIILTIFQDVLHYRQNQKGLLEENLEMKEYVPWSSSERLRQLLIKQHKLTASNLNESVQTPLFQQLMELADVILEGYRYQLASIQDSDHYKEIENQYTTHRYNLILPLYEQKHYERATSLAEKYRDFNILVQVCEDSQDQERLERYMNEFEKFAQFAFEWYIKVGKKSKLLVQPPQLNRELDQFLAGYDSLSWLHNIHTKNYPAAQNTLNILANDERHFVARKKTLLSLSKLACLASSLPDMNKQHYVRELNKDLSLIEAQENLPEAFLEKCDVDNMSPYTPEEVIEVLIGEENEFATEYDYKKALDIYKIVNERNADTEPLLIHIWAQSILRDSWLELSTQDPLESLKETIFFRTIELMLHYYNELEEFLPAYETVVASEELASLNKNANFLFLIQAAYESVSC